MNVDPNQLDRLRRLCDEPERTAMSRSSQFPTVASSVIPLHQEINAVRAGLREALGLIEAFLAEKNQTR